LKNTIGKSKLIFSPFLLGRKEEEMREKRKILGVFCDILTFSRLLFGGALALWGFYTRTEEIRIAILILLAGWTTDILDGKIARAINKKETLIGRNDLRFDALMMVGAVAYIGYTGIISGFLAKIFVLILLSLIAYPKTPYVLLWFFESLAAVTTLPLMVFSEGTMFILVPLIWGVIMLVYDWERAMMMVKKWEEVFQGLFRFV